MTPHVFSTQISLDIFYCGTTHADGGHELVVHPDDLLDVDHARPVVLPVASTVCACPDTSSLVRACEHGPGDERDARDVC